MSINSSNAVAFTYDRGWPSMQLISKLGVWVPGFPESPIIADTTVFPACLSPSISKLDNYHRHSSLSRFYKPKHGGLGCLGPSISRISNYCRYSSISSLLEPQHFQTLQIPQIVQHFQILYNETCINHTCTLMSIHWLNHVTHFKWQWLGTFYYYVNRVPHSSNSSQ